VPENREPSKIVETQKWKGARTKVMPQNLDTQSQVQGKPVFRRKRCHARLARGRHR